MLLACGESVTFEEAPEPEVVASPVRAALAPVIDLLSFEDEPSEAARAPAEAAAPRGALDDIADGMTNGGPQQEQQQQQQNGGAAPQAARSLR